MDTACKGSLHQVQLGLSTAIQQAKGVADRITELFCQFGPSKILQSDNGKEFVAAVINDLQKKWPGLVIIHGRPRHPQSQGCVERGNGDLQQRLGKWMEKNGDSCSEGLKHVIFSMNISISATTTKTPHEVAFGQPPRSHQAEMEILANQGIVTEEDVPEGFFADDIQAEHLASSNDNSPEDNNSETNENDTAAVQQVKRGLNFILLCNNGIVATATQLTGMTRFDGNPFNTTTHAVMSVNDIIDPTHVPVEGNPEKLPLEVGQFLLWKLDDLIRDEEEDTAHREVRLCARQGFLKAARRQLERYETLCGDSRKGLCC